MRWNKRAVLLPAAVLLGSVLTLSWAAQSARFAPAPMSTPQIAPPSPPPHSTEASKRTAPEFFVMIDPSHGGGDRGALLVGHLLEKDVTLSWARDLKRQLEERGISARLVRDSDRTVSLDQRAELTNEARPAVYVALHAGAPGSGVRVYTPAVPFAPQPAAGRFVSWEIAQTASLDRSKYVARAVTAEIRKQERRVDNLAAPLRPLNNVVMPAFAVELASSSKASENQKRQIALASAIASGIAQARGLLGVHP